MTTSRQPTTAEVLEDVRAVIRAHDERKMAELRANRATLARIARMTGAEPPASHLRIVGDSEDEMMGRDPDRPLATVVSLDERRRS
jgi:hypothetical protein